ncbi:MAG: GAF and ANTAR domain-containing protein [Jatrophihabitantaceae bacterium]
MTLFENPGGDDRPAFTAKSGLARRYHAAWAGDRDQATAIPELLPVRLTQACVRVLPVAGAGLSLLDQDFRVPVGASDAMASSAERLQFTQGEGPCLDAARTSRIVIAGEADIREQWPLFAAEFFGQTPYRGALCIPLQLSPDMVGALDFFVTDPHDLAAISLTDAVAVSDQIIAALTIAQALTGSVNAFSDQPEPMWLQSGAVRNRTNVWIAMGMLMTRLNIDAPDALAVLRGYCYSHDAVLDDVADALITGRLDVAQIQP